MSLFSKPTHSDGISHTYEGPWDSLLQTLLAIALTVGACAAVAIGLQKFTPMRSAFLADPDSTILGTKVTMARAVQGVPLVLAGDSSCMMNLDVASLETAGAGDVINLGLFSSLGLDAFGRIAAESMKSAPAGRRVLLALHPECIRIAGISEPHVGVLNSAFGVGTLSALNTENPVASALGFHAFRTAVLDPWVPESIRGSMGAKYGFTECLRREIFSRKGAMDESATLMRTNTGSGEYRIATRLERECALFRKALPTGTRVRLLITPVPKSHALKSHEAKLREIQNKLESWLGAESGEPWMPLILPDEDFGTVTHLTPEAAKRYSRELGAKLAAWK